MSKIVKVEEEITRYNPYDIYYALQELLLQNLKAKAIGGADAYIKTRNQLQDGIMVLDEDFVKFMVSRYQGVVRTDKEKFNVRYEDVYESKTAKIVRLKITVPPYSHIKEFMGGGNI